MGERGDGLFVEQHGDSEETPEQTVSHTQRTPCGSLESAGLLQWLVFAAVPKESPSLTSHIEEFLLTDVCWFTQFTSCLKCLQACWLLKCHQLLSAVKKFSMTQAPLLKEWVRAHSINSCAVSVFSRVFFVRFDLTWFLTWRAKCLMLRDFTCQLTEMSEAPIRMFLNMTAKAHLSYAVLLTVWKPNKKMSRSE